MRTDIARQLRELRGFDILQQELAEKAGTSRQSISQYERGERIPSTAALESILCAMDVPAPQRHRYHDARTRAVLEQQRVYPLDNSA